MNENMGQTPVDVEKGIQGSMKQPSIQAEFPMYPNLHSEEAHMRAKYLQEELTMLDEHHEHYVALYNDRRNELELMLAMCHQVINTYDQVTGPQHSMPMSQVPGRDRTKPEMRSPYDVGLRPPNI